jgi:hypothetical protein
MVGSMIVNHDGVLIQMANIEPRRKKKAKVTSPAIVPVFQPPAIHPIIRLIVGNTNDKRKNTLDRHPFFLS